MYSLAAQTYVQNIHAKVGNDPGSYNMIMYMYNMLYHHGITCLLQWHTSMIWHIAHSVFMIQQVHFVDASD